MKKIIFIFLLIFLAACGKNKQENEIMESVYQNIRQPAVAGQFYPAEANNLKAEIEQYLQSITSPQPPPSQGVGDKDTIIKAIMVPHAGYDFSAPVAAYSYKQLQGKTINTAVIICNSHSSYFSGIAINESDAWQTPLGLVAVDKVLAEKLVNADDVIKFNSKVHQDDHTLEVQLPFLQTVLTGEFKIVPILFGNTDDESYKKLAQALFDNLGANDLVIISTDMSHYPSYEDANRVDSKTLDMIQSADVAKLVEHIKEIESQNIANEQTVLCGIDGVKTVMELYKLANWDKIEILKYANSGDVVIGDKSSVVGYGAVAFIKLKSLKRYGSALGADMLDIQQQKQLLNIARTTVESYVKDGKTPEFDITDERLKWQEGAFVTIHNDGKLRGCIGQIVPTDDPLWQVVRDKAISVATEDYRFSPVKEKELEELDYEISVLSVPEKINNWQDIELGKHGVIVRKGMHGGVFLPQVATETGWSLEEFLAQLCSQKAGLPADCYKNDPEVELQIFSAQVFSESDIK